MRTLEMLWETDENGNLVCRWAAPETRPRYDGIVVLSGCWSTCWHSERLELLPWNVREIRMQRNRGDLRYSNEPGPNL